MLCEWLATCIVPKIFYRKPVFTEIENFSDGEETYEIDDAVDPAQVQELIKKLPEGARQILVMRALEGYRHAEIGEILGISESTAKTQFFRAKKLLAEMINSQQYETTTGSIPKGKKIIV